MKKNLFQNMKKTSRKSLVTYLICFSFFAAVRIMGATDSLTRHFSSLLVPICINVILAVSLNLVIGFLGELSLGHAGFMSVGAYAGCLFAIKFKEILPAAVRLPLEMLVGGMVAALFGLLVGIPVLRLKGDYLAIVTLAFGEILRSVIINLNFTGGASGLKGTPQDATFTAGFAAVILTLFVILNLADSKHGRAIMSLRENAIAASSVGINANGYKLMVFSLSAFFAGIAGVLYGSSVSILSASTFDYNKSIEILVMVVLGGMGSIRGSVIAAALITILPESMRALADYRMLIYALALIVMMILGTSEKFMLLRHALSPRRLLSKAAKHFRYKKEGQNNG